MPQYKPERKEGGRNGGGDKGTDEGEEEGRKREEGSERDRVVYRNWKCGLGAPSDLRRQCMISLILRLVSFTVFWRRHC